MTTRSLLASLLAALSLSLIASTASARPATIADLERIETIGDAHISPDGRDVLYTVTTTDVAADTQRTSIWRVGWDGATPVRVTRPEDGASAPRWSPDGRWISFIQSQGDAPGQLWLLDRRGGSAPKRATDVGGGIDHYVWSPDSRRLALVRRVETPLRKGADGKQIPEPWVIDRVRFKEDAGDGYLHNRIKPPRIYLYDLQAQTLDALTAGGEFEEDSPSWSPDGDRIAFVSNRQPDWQHSDYGDIFVAPTRAGSTPTRLTDFPGYEGAPAWSPDGRQIVFAHGSDPQYWMYNQLDLASVPAAGGPIRRLATALDRDIGDPVFSPDGRTIRFLAADDLEHVLAQVPANDGKVEPLLKGGHYIASMSQSRDGRIAVVAASEGVPPELHALENGKLRALTRHNAEWTRGLDLVKREAIAFRGVDGEDVHGLLARPVGYQAGRRYPTVMWLHGGPYGRDEYGFDPTVQLLAANGYAVVQVNYRGSLGRGRTHGRGIFGDWGNRDVTDSLAGIEYVVGMGIADPQRLGVGGWSYGGFLTDFIIVSDTRFKAAVSGAGSPTKTSLYGTDLYAHGNELEWGTPWDNTEMWMRVSRPLFQANRVRTPTLFLHGAKDYNVPVSGSEQMYRALKTLRIPTQLVIYPDEHHGIHRPSFSRDLSQRLLDWYRTHLLNDAAAKAATTTTASQ
ncbi:S9 family peptidase [Luteimonas sp. RIT-PG2_3]